jgi:hypothetical protein
LKYLHFEAQVKYLVVKCFLAKTSVNCNGETQKLSCQRHFGRACQGLHFCVELTPLRTLVLQTLCEVVKQGVYELKPVGANMHRTLSIMHSDYMDVPINLYAR